MAGSRDESSAATMWLSHEALASSSEGMHFVSPGIETATTATASPEGIQAVMLVTTTRDSGVAGLVHSADMEAVAAGSSASAGAAPQLPVKISREGTARASSATTVGREDVNGKPAVYLAKDVQPGTTYSDAQDNDGRIDSRSSSVNRSERAGGGRKCCSPCVSSEALANSLCEMGLLKDPSSNGGRCKDELRCNKICRGSTPPHITYSISENSCNMYLSNKGEKRKDSLFFASAGGKEAAVDKTASSPVSVADPQVLELGTRCDASDALLERSHMGTHIQLQAGEESWRQVLEPQKAHQRQQEQGPVQLREQRDWLQTQGCLRQQPGVGQPAQEQTDARQELQLEMHFSRQQHLNYAKETDGSHGQTGGEEQRQFCNNSSQHASVGTSGPRLMISWCGQAGQVEAFNKLQEEQAGFFPSAEKVESVDGTTVLQSKKCCSRSSAAGVQLSTHTPFVLQFPQPGASAAGVHCCRGQPNDKLPLIPRSLHRTIQVGSATFAASSFPHVQLTAGASQCGDVAFLRGSTRRPADAVPQSRPADTVAHWKPVCSSAGRRGTAAVSLLDDCSCLRTIPAPHCDTAWQRTSSADKGIQCANRGSSADVHSCPVKGQTHLAIAVSESAAVPPLATSFCGHPAGFVTPRLSSSEYIDSLRQQQVPHRMQREHQLPQGRIYQEELEQLQSQQSVRMQQQQARGLDIGCGWAQQEREVGHSKKQWSSPIPVRSLRADHTAREDETRRKWLTAVPAWVVATVAEDEAGTEAEAAGNRQEVRPVSLNSIFSTSRSSDSAAVSIHLLEEEEAQRAHGEGVGTRLPGRGLLLYSQPRAALAEERFTQQQTQALGLQQRQLELLRFPQHGELQEQQQEVLAGPLQQEVQQQDSGGSYSYVERRVKSNDKKERLPCDAHSSSGSDAFLVDENGLHSWISDDVRSRYTVASVIPCSLTQPKLDEEGAKGDRTPCAGQSIHTSVVYSGTETCTGERWCYSSCPPTYVGGTVCGSAATPVLTTVGEESRSYQASYICGLPCSRFVAQPRADSEPTAVGFQSVLPYPMRLLRSVGVVGAPPAVAEPGAAREMNALGGDRETAKEEQSTSPRRIGRSQSVLKRAASADPASGRFARVKTVSFANLNECENSMVGRSTTTSKGIDPTSAGGAASTSLPLCISSSNSDTVVPREIGKGSVGNTIRGSVRKGETAIAAAKRGTGGASGEREMAEVSLEMQRVDLGKAKKKAGDAGASIGRQEAAAGASQGRRREESSAQAMERKKKPSGGRFRTSLTAAVGMLRAGGCEGGAVAAAERGPERRQEAEGKNGIFPNRDLSSSSSSLLSEDTLMRRSEDVVSAGRNRGEVQSSSRSSGDEESGADSSEGDREEGSQRRKRRETNRRRGRRSSDSVRSHRGSNRDRRTSGYRARRIGRGSRSARASPSSESLVVKASTRLTQMFRNFFRAVQNLTEHDTVFRMQDELSTRSSRLLPRGAAPGSEVTGGGSSVSSAPVAGTTGASGSRSSPRNGTGGAAGTGLRQGYSAADSITGTAAGGGVTTRGGIAAENSLSRSGSSDALLRRLPLKFVDGDLEALFAGNINKWMTARLLLMGLLMLVVTSLMWPLMAWSFNLQDAFNHSEPIGVLFHVDMSLNVIVSLLFIVTRFSNTLTDHAELIGDAGTFVVITIWGIWNTIASFILESSYVRDVIHPQTIGGHQGYVSLEKTTSWSSAQEASSAVAYLYGLLLIVQLDVVYPSRTRRTWQIHLMFFILSSSSIIVRGAINPNFVPIPFVVIRVATYLMLTIFLYVGRHATELQQRQTFYNWLMTRKRVDRLESDLKRQKESGKVSTAVEQLVDLIKQCKETFQSLEAGLPDASSFHRTQLDECNRTLDRCLSILTNTTNLYTVQFGELDSDTHRDIIQAFLNTHNSSPADWARMTRGAFSRVEGGLYAPTLSQAARQPSGRTGAFDQGITLDELASRGAPSDTATQRRSTSSHVSSEVGYSPISSKGHADEPQLGNALLRRASSAGPGAVASVSAGAPFIPPSTPTAVDASPGRTTAEESKISPREPHGDALFDFTYTSPRGREFFDEEPVFVQSTSKRSRQLEEQGAPLFGASEGGLEKGESVLRTAAVPERQGDAQRDRRGRFAHLLPRTALAAPDVGLCRKWSTTPPAGKEAAGGGARIASAPGYESPTSSVLEEISGKRIDGRILRESRATVADRDANGGSTLARELARLGKNGGVAFPAEAQPSGAGVVDRAEGRRLSSAVAPDEVKDEAAGATVGVGTAQQKDVLPREYVIPAPADGRHPSSTTADLASGRKGAVAGALVYRAFVMDQRARREMRARNEAVATVLSLPTGSPQLNFVQRLSEEEVLTWDFDCLLHAKESPAPLMDIGYALLSRPCENLLLPNKEVLVRFLKAVEAQYNAVPYHNSIHGCMVTQKMIALTHLMQLTNKVSNRDLAVMIVAGLCHDLGHPGRNNALLINAIDPVAVLYNDKSVLENYHSCLTFKTLDLPDCDIFWVLRSKLRREYHVMRSLIIELILATDMKNHFETVSRFRIRRLAADFDISAEEDLWFLLKIVIKCADLSHCGVSWSQHFEWCLRLCTEFYDQGDEELARHLPVSPLCEREKHTEVAKAQLGFMNFVTIPLYEELVAVDTTGNVECYCISYMKANVRNWELTASAGVRVPLYGKDLTFDVQPPFSRLLDQNQHPNPKPGSKAAEIASRYAHVTLTCVDLTPLVMRTQLSRSQRESQLLTDRLSDVPTKRGAT